MNTKSDVNVEISKDSDLENDKLEQCGKIVLKNSMQTHLENNHCISHLKLKNKLIKNKKKVT